MQELPFEGLLLSLEISAFLCPNLRFFLTIVERLPPKGVKSHKKNPALKGCNTGTNISCWGLGKRLISLMKPGVMEYWSFGMDSHCE